MDEKVIFWVQSCRTVIGYLDAQYCKNQHFFNHWKFFRYKSGEGTIKEIDGSDNEVSVYDNVPRSNSGGSRRFRKHKHQTRHLKPTSPTGSRKLRGSRKSSGGSTIDRIRYIFFTMTGYQYETVLILHSFFACV